MYTTFYKCNFFADMFFANALNAVSAKHFLSEYFYIKHKLRANRNVNKIGSQKKSENKVEKHQI